MEIPSKAKFKYRCVEALLTCPKIFFGAFLWEGFSLGCKCSDYAMSFYWMAGLGCAVGTHMGHVLGIFIAQKANIHGHFSYMDEFLKGLLYAVCVILGPGTAWQRIVNDTDDWGFTFTQAFFLMWLFSMLLFFTALTFFRKLLAIAAERWNIQSFKHLQSTYYKDITLSFAVGCGDAFFMGTSAPENFDDNWLAPTFGVYPETPVGTAMLSAGASTLCGFVIVCFVQNCLFKYNWTDPKHDDAEESLLKAAIGNIIEGESNDDMRKSLSISLVPNDTIC